MKNVTQLLSFRRNLKFILFSNLAFFSCEKKYEIPNCIESREIAKSDFKKGKYIYYEYLYLTDDISSNDKFVDILKMENIKVIYKRKYPISDVIVPEEKIDISKKCYQTMMNYQIEAKFGVPFLDSARIAAKKIEIVKP